MPYAESPDHKSDGNHCVESDEFQLHDFIAFMYERTTPVVATFVVRRGSSAAASPGPEQNLGGRVHPALRWIKPEPGFGPLRWSIQKEGTPWPSTLLTISFLVRAAKRKSPAGNNDGALAGTHPAGAGGG